MLQQPLIRISYLEQIRHIPRIMIPIQQMSERHRNWPGLFTRLTEKTKPAVRSSVQHRRLFKPTTAKSWDAATRARNREGGDVVIRALKWRPRARAKWITSPQIERSLCVRKLVPHAGFRARGVHWSWGAGERLGSLICRWSRETEGAGSDRLQEGWAGREQPERMSQAVEKLIEPVLIEKSPDSPSCCAGAAAVAHVKRLAKNWGVMGWV